VTTGEVKQTNVRLHWIDNSNDEDGFRIYRDSVLIGTASTNTVTYEDTGLKPATTYRYVVRAYNQAGESGDAYCTVRTLNPSVTVRLDGIGVHDNGESGLRDFDDGEVYVYVVVADGNTTVKQRCPTQEGNYFYLDDDEAVEIGETIFSSSEVGDSLAITFVGYERDGGPFEQLVFQALGIAVESQVTGGAGGLLEAFDIGLGGLIGQFFGIEDDWLGSYENTWDSNDNWGVGTYIDIACEKEDGALGLRLWFTIESATEPIVSPQTTAPSTSTVSLPPNPTNEELLQTVSYRLRSLAQTSEAEEYVSIFLTNLFFYVENLTEKEVWIVGICPGPGAWDLTDKTDWFRVAEKDYFFDTHWGEPKATWIVYRDGGMTPTGKGLLVEEDIARLNTVRVLE